MANPGDFTSELQDVRTMLRMFKGFQQLEDVLARAVDANNVIAEMERRRDALAHEMDALTTKLRSAQAAHVATLEQQTAAYAPKIAALTKTLHDAEADTQARLAALGAEIAKAHDAMTADMEDINARRAAAQQELAAVTAQLAEAKTAWEALRAKIV